MKTYNLLENDKFAEIINKQSRLIGIDHGKKNIGISTLVKIISKKIDDHFKVNEDNIISRERHKKSLENTVFFIEKCLNKKSINQIDLAAEDLRLAVRNLGEIVGYVNVEELLDRIFKDFCIGK